MKTNAKKPKKSTRDLFNRDVANHANKLVASGMSAQAAIVIAEAVVARAWLYKPEKAPN